MTKKTFFIVSGNINGNEVKPRLCATREAADKAIVESFLSVMRDRNYINQEGKFKDSVMVSIYLGDKGGSSGLDPWLEKQAYECLERLEKNKAADEHIECVTFRHRRSCHIFAEWQVTEATV